MPIEQFFFYIIIRTSYIWWNDNDVHFVLDQHAQLDFYTASSLKQKSAGRHVAPHYSDSEPANLCSFSLMLHSKWRSNKYQFYRFCFEATSLKMSMLTITPAIKFIVWKRGYHHHICKHHIVYRPTTISIYLQYHCIQTYYNLHIFTVSLMFLFGY